MTASEHILLESDLREVPDLRDARKSHGRLEVRSRLRRHVLQLEIIDYYYLSVRSRTGVTGLEFTGGPGTFRALRPFVAKLTAHIRLASAARRRTKAEHLRDEMREHQRLRELGVLSVSDYEASKARILGQHARGHR